jgi:hypothetical protein
LINIENSKTIPGCSRVFHPPKNLNCLKYIGKVGECSTLPKNRGGDPTKKNGLVLCDDCIHSKEISKDVGFVECHGDPYDGHTGQLRGILHPCEGYQQRRNS